MATIIPMNREIAAAIGGFFDGGGGPSHARIEEVLNDAGLPTARESEWEGKATRVRRILRGVIANVFEPARGSQFVEEVLAAIRAHGGFDPSSPRFSGPLAIAAAKRAFAGVGWELTDDGTLHPVTLADIPNEDLRPVLEKALLRIRHASTHDDIALLLGQAKELLETTAKHVLDTLDWPYRANADFGELMHHARDRLLLLPQNVDANSDSAQATKPLFDGIGKIVAAIDDLRRKEGTGHGRTKLPTTESPTAIFVVRTSANIAELMLARLDAARGS